MRPTEAPFERQSRIAKTEAQSGERSFGPEPNGRGILTPTLPTSVRPGASQELYAPFQCRSWPALRSQGAPLCIWRLASTFSTRPSPWARLRAPTTTVAVCCGPPVQTRRCACQRSSMRLIGTDPGTNVLKAFRETLRPSAVPSLRLPDMILSFPSSPPPPPKKRNRQRCWAAAPFPRSHAYQRRRARQTALCCGAPPCRRT